MAETLDLRGLKCPLPALLARRALARLPPGAALTVTADDPLAAVDIPYMCQHEGHAVESVTRHDGCTHLLLRRGVSPGCPVLEEPPPDPDGR